MLRPARKIKTKAYRFWHRFSRQSLTIKLIVAFSLIVFVLVLLGATVMMSISKKAIAETSVTTALYRTQLLKTKLIETMIQEDMPHEKLQSTLEDTHFGESVGEINIFNPEGEIRFSNVKENIAKKIEIPSEAGKDDVITSDEGVIQLGTIQEKGRLRIIHPIKGGTQCMSCHTPNSKNMLGGIELFISLSPIYRRFTMNRVLFLSSAVGLVLVGAFLIRFLVRGLVKRPIKKLRNLMEKAEKGELNVRTQIPEDPDLERLAKSFNSMVRGIELAQKRLGQQHQRELAQANRLASLGLLISNVSHEIKNPLTSISSTLHALKNELKQVDGQEIFEELTLQVNRIEQTVNQLLRYAKQDPPHFESCSILGPIRHALRLAEHRFQKNEIQTRIKCSMENPNVWADSGQLQQVFLNLFLNAANAMPKGGNLDIFVQASPEGRPGVSVHIKDTGCGILSTEIEKVFTPFYTTHPSGTGLGLPVVKGIVELHKGTIDIQSQAGKGTEVSIFFPNGQHSN